MFKSLLATAAFATLSIAPTQSFAHGGSETRVGIEPESPVVADAGKVEYSFDLVDNEQKKVITDADLKVDHEKLIHFIVYDDALTDFQHVHPEFKDGKWNVELTFKKSGNYWLWAQGVLASDGSDFTASANLKITNGEAANPKADLADLRTGKSGNSVVTLSKDVLHAGKMAMLMLKYSRTDGTKPAITPYLGAKAHVTAVSDDADAMIHAHPMDTSLPDQIMIHTTFPNAGFFRIWVEFIDGGTLKRVALAVEVLK